MICSSLLISDKKVFPRSYASVKAIVWMHHLDINEKHGVKAEWKLLSRMLHGVLKKSYKQHSTKPQFYGYLPPLSQTIQGTQTRHVGNCWRSKDELISNVLLWTLLDIYIYIYIYILSSTDRLFHCITTLQCG